MAFVSIRTVPGDPKELLPKYDQVSAKVLPNPAPGMIMHTCVELDDGIRVVNMFENEGQARAANQRPELLQALQEAGMPAAEPQILRVHNYRIFRQS
jgi:hypothetical protein